MNYYNFHIGDWVLHTNHLTLEEEAIYRRLIDYYYQTEKPIPEKTEPVIRRLRLGNHSDTVGLILEEFFTLEDDGWHNKRVDSELNRYKNRVSIAKENGKKGGRPKQKQGVKTKSVNSANPTKSQTKTNQEPITNNQEPNNKNKTNDRFDDFWRAFSDTRGKPGAKKAWRKINPDDALADKIISGARRYVSKRGSDDKYWKMAQGWLNDERWNDDVEVGPVNELHTAAWWRAYLGGVDKRVMRERLQNGWNPDHGANPWKKINDKMPPEIRQEYAAAWKWKED